MFPPITNTAHRSPAGRLGIDHIAEPIHLDRAALGQRMLKQGTATLHPGVEVEKVTDMATILGYGVMSTPGVVMNGKVVHAGGVPQPDKVESWLHG